MEKIFEITDKTKRVISLTKERYEHILKHLDMQNQIENIKITLENPLKITDYPLEEDIKYYYKYHKERKSRAKYLRVIVKYLNGKGYIVTAYYVEHLRWKEKWPSTMMMKQIS